MSQPYVGEIRLFAGNFAPQGWHFCDGAILAIASNEVLFNLIGTTYGGDGQQTFALPDLRGRILVHQGSGHTIGELSGVETVTLTAQQIPAHSHPLTATKNLGTSGNPANFVPARLTTPDIYTLGPTQGPMAAASIGVAGGSQPHNNLQPYLCISFIISLNGVFPTQN